MKRVTLYTMENCPYCIQAKALLSECGIQYQETVLDYDDDEAWERLKKMCPGKTVPQLFVDGMYVGDHQTIDKLYQQDKLKGLK
jgi:glutaredoxin